MTNVPMASEVLLVGGRSGTGKSSVAFELHARLRRAGVAHCLIDGDFLDMAFPAPREHAVAERNLAAMWRNYRSLGHRRLIYTNTLCVLPEMIERVTTAMADDPVVVAVLLTCTDETARRRLTGREIGSALQTHLAASAAADARLRHDAATSAHHVRTDHETVTDIATRVIELAGWRPR